MSETLQNPGLRAEALSEQKLRDQLESIEKDYGEIQDLMVSLKSAMSRLDQRMEALQAQLDLPAQTDPEETPFIPEQASSNDESEAAEQSERKRFWTPLKKTIGAVALTAAVIFGVTQYDRDAVENNDDGLAAASEDDGEIADPIFSDKSEDNEMTTVSSRDDTGAADEDAERQNQLNRDQEELTEADFAAAQDAINSLGQGDNLSVFKQDWNTDIFSMSPVEAGVYSMNSGAVIEAAEDGHFTINDSIHGSMDVLNGKYGEDRAAHAVETMTNMGFNASQIEEFAQNGNIEGFQTFAVQADRAGTFTNTPYVTQNGEGEVAEGTRQFAAGDIFLIHLNEETGEVVVTRVDCGAFLQYGDFVFPDEPPVEEPPVDEPPIDEPPIDEPPVEEPPVDEPPVDEPPIDEPPEEPIMLEVCDPATGVIIDVTEDEFNEGDWWIIGDLPEGITIVDGRCVHAPADGPPPVAEQEPHTDTATPTPGYPGRGHAEDVVEDQQGDPTNLDDTEFGTEVPDSQDGGEAPGGGEESVVDEIPHTDDEGNEIDQENPDHDEDVTSPGTDEGTSNDAESEDADTGEEDEETNTDDPLDGGFPGVTGSN